MVLYDATAKKETVKISNTAAPAQDNSDYQVGKEIKNKNLVDKQIQSD